jgi:hypothetical protein
VDAPPVNETTRHFAALAGYGRAEGYLELRWRAQRAAWSAALAETRILLLDLLLATDEPTVDGGAG